MKVESEFGSPMCVKIDRFIVLLLVVLALTTSQLDAQESLASFDTESHAASRIDASTAILPDVEQRGSDFFSLANASDINDLGSNGFGIAQAAWFGQPVVSGGSSRRTAQRQEEYYSAPGAPLSRPEVPDESFPSDGSYFPPPVDQPLQDSQSQPPSLFQHEDSVATTQIAPVGCVTCTARCRGRGCRTRDRPCCGSCHLRGRTRIGRFLNGVREGICNPDPCYQPKWTILANASLFTDAVRPQTRQRFRWDYNHRYLFADRAEFLWARAGRLGPAAEQSINFHELTMYVETGSEKFSFFVETPYRSIDLESGGHFAGFADLTTGTKTLLHDTSLLQVALQFETHIPTASPSKGLSNGHVSLEPSLLFGIQASPRSFIQAQIGEWIPIAGDETFAGASLRYSASYNRTLIQRASNTSLTATIEYSGLSFQDGAYTDPTTSAIVPASDESIGMLGTGLRLNVCDKMNIGFGVQYGVTETSPQTLFRTEIQFRH